MKNGPIFIAGLERSGTSLIYALLASHPNIAMTRRTNLWTYFYNQYGDLSKSSNFERCLKDLMRYKRLVPVGLNAEKLKLDFLNGEMTYPRLFALIEEQYAQRLGRPRWGDKSLNTERYADEIFAAYPNARILHMQRDPRDRYASAVKRWKVSRGGAGVGSAVWLSSLKLAKRHEAKYPNQYMIICYETLAREPEKTLRQICDFIGEEYTPEMLTMNGASDHTSSGGNSSFGKIEPGKISQKPIGRYREVLSNIEIAYIQLIAGSFMKQLGYQRDPVKLSVGEILKFYGQVLPSSLMRTFGWMLLNTLKIMRGEPLPRSRMLPENKQDIEGQYV